MYLHAARSPVFSQISLSSSLLIFSHYFLDACISFPATHFISSRRATRPAPLDINYLPVRLISFIQLDLFDKGQSF